MLSSNTSGVSEDANYIESVFSTYLYTGNGSTQTITNGIDLSTKGGLVWCKARTTGGLYHTLTDTVTGASKALFSNDTSSQLSGNYVTAFGTTGFSIGNNGYLNYNNEPTVSWTFRKQPKFFDVVTYTGDGTNNRAVAHNLGSVPGCIIVKMTNASGTNWAVYHRDVGTGGYLLLNLTNATQTFQSLFNTPTSTNFYLNKGTGGMVNDNGDSYVAYLFAHDAGGFGLTGTDNVISCGSFVGTGSNQTINLGYEPQLLLTKRYDGTGNWVITDIMRGQDASFNGNYIYPNLANAETGVISSGFSLTSTGFITNASSNYIYIAIRRGPMKVPTDGTKVFAPVTRTGTGASSSVTAGFAPDLLIPVNRPHDFGGSTNWTDKLRGVDKFLYSNSTAVEETRADAFTFGMNGGVFGTNAVANASTASYINWFFKRAPSFFDEVCYTGTGSNLTVAHNLGAAPELVIVKNRTGVFNWPVSFNFTATNQSYSFLNATSAGANDTYANIGLMNAQPTATNLYLLPTSTMNASGSTYVAYLFATCAGVSKVGSYTGTGTTKQVDCGFAAGARFVLIKRTDSTGDWYVWDTARGIVSGNDPYLLLNSTAAEDTSTDYIDTYSAGFELSSTAPAALNASGSTYIFLAIA